MLGQDDTYPKNRRGEPIEPVKFTIHAEKCPNRRGVEEVLKHFQGEVVSFDDVLWSAGEGRVQAMYIAASAPPREVSWISAEQATGLKRVPLLIVQDLLPSPASELATYLLPGGSVFGEGRHVRESRGPGADGEAGNASAARRRGPMRRSSSTWPGAAAWRTPPRCEKSWPPRSPTSRRWPPATSARTAFRWKARSNHRDTETQKRPGDR